MEANPRAQTDPEAANVTEGDQQTQPEDTAAPGPIVLNLDPTQNATEISSYCVNCGETGLTRLLLTRIPHFREVAIMAFECPHCFYRNSEIQSVGSIAEKGCTYTCKVVDSKDIDRQIVRSEWATVSIPELDFEVPPTKERGSLTTIEGFIQSCAQDLEFQQPYRRATDQAVYEQIQSFIDRLKGLLELRHPFTLVVDDPSGNSYIENLHLPRTDPQLHVKLYVRTLENDRALGLAAPAEDDEDQAIDAPADVDQTINPANVRAAHFHFLVACMHGIGWADLDPSIMVFPSICNSCGAATECKMHEIDIPYFRQVIIMAVNCDHCGFRSSEVKSGGAISDKGRKIVLTLTDAEDLSRDVLKSDSCAISVPELELEVQSGTLGSKFTTIEGLLSEIHDQIKANPFMIGDSSRDRHRFDAFLTKLKQLQNGDLLPATFVMNDPLGVSYLQNLYAPDPDPNMEVTEYQRSWEDNEDFGLNDIHTEGYEAVANGSHADGGVPAEQAQEPKHC